MVLRPIVKEWLAELRSGKLTQTKNVLGHPDGSRCCLGVACDIAVKHGIIPAPIEVVDPTSISTDPTASGNAPVMALKYGDLISGFEVQSLPPAVMRAFGFNTMIGHYSSQGRKDFLERHKDDGDLHSSNPDTNLARDNDNLGRTFAEIADIVEANAEELFQPFDPVAEWLKRLRSGSIKQIVNKLADAKGGRCCLGVACDIAVEQGIIPPPAESQLPHFSGFLRYKNEVSDRDCDGTITGLPSKVQEFFGLTTAGGQYYKEYPVGHQDALVRESTGLITDNDDHRKTFAQIADIIESKPNGLFLTVPEDKPLNDPEAAL